MPTEQPFPEGAFTNDAASQRAALQKIGTAFSIDREPFRVLEQRTISVDRLIGQTVDKCLKGTLSDPFAIFAVGGYGRRELFPYSDVDLLVVFEDEQQIADAKEPLSEFCRVIWDAGLQLSHSVRTVGECCRLQNDNTELHISLLDRRFLQGNEQLFAKLSSDLAEFQERAATKIISRLAKLVNYRHKKYNDTVYHLEPNIKECPGGVRDVHLLHWLSKLSPRNEAVQEAVPQLRNACAFLYQLRCFLHFKAGRGNNLLTFELQDDASASLSEISIDPGEWMRIYYGHARRVYQYASHALESFFMPNVSLVQRLRSRRSRLSTDELTVFNERIFLRSALKTLVSAEAVLQLFVFVGRHGILLSWDTQRHIRARLGAISFSFRDHSPSWPEWRELLSQPHVATALHQMQETGVLAAAIPEWQSIDSLVVRDFYHRYTVDEHTIAAIGVIDELLEGTNQSTLRLRGLLQEDDDLPILRLALLLHDIGKGITPGDHVRGSLETSDIIMRRLGAPEQERQTVRFLIEHHLDLSLIMNGRDLEDPATARFLTASADTPKNLRTLTLLTFADISAVNPTAMTPWRLEQLWRVYLMGLDQLTRELVTDRISADDLSLANASPLLIQFLEGFPTRYLRTYSREQVQQHFDLSRQAQKSGVAVEVELNVDAYQMTVIARDEPGLFACLCGALASFGMNIVKADAFSNSSNTALDVFRFADPMSTLALNPGEIECLVSTVESVVHGSIEVANLLKRRRSIPRPSNGSRIAPVVRFNNEASDQSTLIDFTGEDRPALLYHLASTLSVAGCNIDLVMIDTEAHKAIDVFYVTADGKKLDAATQVQLQASLLQAADER